MWAHQKTQLYPGLYPKQCGQQGKGGDSASLLWWDPQATFSCGILSTERMLMCCSESRKGSWRWLEGWSPSPVKKASKPRLFSLKKRRPQGDLNVALGYLKKSYKKDWADILARLLQYDRGNGFKLKWGLFRTPGKRKKIFMLRMMNHWQKFPGLTHPWKRSRPSWMRLWAACSSGRCPCSLQGTWTTWPLKVPYHTNHCMILRNWNMWNQLFLWNILTAKRMWQKPQFKKDNPFVITLS